jgi:4-hydroxy-tetrahydrodipicolinate reductase
VTPADPAGRGGPSPADEGGSLALRVGILGGNGRLGRALAVGLAAYDDVRVVGATSRRAVGEPVPGAPGVSYVADVAGLLAADPEVVIDASDREVAVPQALAVAAAGVHDVIAVSGLGPAELAELERCFSGSAGGRANGMWVPNFSIGAVLLEVLAETVAPFVAAAEIVETHHATKRDAPSGSALALAEVVAAARRAAASPPLRPAETAHEAVPGSRGGVVGGVPIHALRLLDAPARQELVCALDGQLLRLVHEVSDRRAYVGGAHAAIRAVGRHPGFVVGLRRALGLESRPR